MWRTRIFPINARATSVAGRRKNDRGSFLKDDFDLLEITSFTIDYSPPGEVLIHWSSRDRGARCSWNVQPGYETGSTCARRGLTSSVPPTGPATPGARTALRSTASRALPYLPG